MYADFKKKRLSEIAFSMNSPPKLLPVSNQSVTPNGFYEIMTTVVSLPIKFTVRHG